MALLDKLLGSTGEPVLSEREEKLQELIREGNEACKKLHGYFYKEPDVQIILKERQEMYQMEEGTRYSVDKKGNRILNYQGD